MLSAITLKANTRWSTPAQLCFQALATLQHKLRSGKSRKPWIWHITGLGRVAKPTMASGVCNGVQPRETGNIAKVAIMVCR
eukprot:CAMPEP_0172736842 /NCGR_PEP_ID=MMETSP1074-20121228/116140_1 /TAXON_ID=2916 /ORGANISM="Ceratium fusus, Strain PA161109" /LENGTH=80 /DNA_ID=CAMNT_0013566123 /DNA_START=50 /DNA_END=289 /DNA_ORIENTATION=-